MVGSNIVLTLHSQHLLAIESHGAQTYPHECCGLLIGQSTGAGDGQKVLKTLHPTQNSWGSQDGIDRDTKYTTRRRYWVAPSELLQTQKVARTLGCDIIGVYHSHPDHPAIPSECDRKWAWPQYSYIIVSVQNGIACDLQSWMLDDQNVFQPEPITLIDS